MTARFEVVRTDAGWHGRFVAANGRIVWWTETYTRRRSAVRAIHLTDDMDAICRLTFGDVDERSKP